MGPLVRVTYSGLNQSVFILDRVKSSSCDCPEKIHVTVDSNASCFTCFSSGRNSPKVTEFCQRGIYSFLLPLRGGGSTRKWGSQFMLREVEPSFKEFLASPVRMRFQVLKSFLLHPN
jgi:hypothetical protein